MVWYPDGMGKALGLMPSPSDNSLCLVEIPDAFLVSTRQILCSL